jgi:hypothetical protein
MSGSPRPLAAACRPGPPTVHLVTTQTHGFIFSIGFRGYRHPAVHPPGPTRRPAPGHRPCNTDSSAPLLSPRLPRTSLGPGDRFHLFYAVPLPRTVAPTSPSRPPPTLSHNPNSPAGIDISDRHPPLYSDISDNKSAHNAPVRNASLLRTDVLQTSCHNTPEPQLLGRSRSTLRSLVSRRTPPLPFIPFLCVSSVPDFLLYSSSPLAIPSTPDTLVTVRDADSPLRPHPSTGLSGPPVSSVGLPARYIPFLRDPTLFSVSPFLNFSRATDPLHITHSPLNLIYLRLHLRRA